jgi:LysM repeat protein
MRVRTRSACVALAWGIIMLIITAAGPTGPFRPAQANTRIASSTSTTSSTSNTIQVTLTSSAAHPLTRTTTTAAGTAAEAQTAGPATGATGGYVVQPGDTLSGIATALRTPGGWPALYAATRHVIGSDPGLIRPGTVLALPGRAASARYTVGAGDTLSGIADALGIPGGWPALYAANRRVIGPDPDAIDAGTTLAIPRPAPAGAQASAQGRASAPTQPSTPASGRSSTPAAGRPLAPAVRQRHPASAHPAATAGLPRWLEIVLLVAGLLIGTAFLTEPTLAIARRRRAARPGGVGARIVLADYDRLVVTHCGTDGNIYVLRPPDADPEAILLAARLVLAQDRYEELAGHLGVPAHWPRE